METISIGELICTLKRSRRKSVAVKITRDGDAVVLAPYGISAENIRHMTEKYVSRIKAECDARKRCAAERAAFVPDYGARVRVLGEERVICGADTVCDGVPFNIPSGLSGDSLRCAVADEYKRLAAEHIGELVRVRSEMMGLCPTAVKINSARSHWASCSRKGSLNFSWCCIMADPQSLDYIVVHELCHMRHFNHSAEFWKEVERYVPHYPVYRQKLKELWRQISMENWFEP